MKVFLSSSYSDLQEYRHAVSSVIASLGHKLISWEQEIIQTGELISKTMNKHIEAADLIVLILGDQVGAISKDQKASYTEREYNSAFENGKPVMVFIKNNGSDTPLDAFSTRIMNQQLVTFFASPHELETKVIESILKYVNVVNSLQNQQFKWRTISGVSKETHLSKEIVSNIVEGLPNVVIRSRIPDKDGKSLYTTREHYKKSNSSVTRLIDWFAV